MNLKSKRFFLALLAGMTASLLITIFLYPTCLGMVAGIIVSVYLAKAESARDGALVGAITVIPTGIFVIYLINMDVGTIETLGLLLAVPVLLLSIVIISGMGALCGLGVGLLLQKVKERNWMM